MTSFYLDYSVQTPSLIRSRSELLGVRTPMYLFWEYTVQTIVSFMGSVVRISGTAQLMVLALSCGCRQMVGQRGVAGTAGSWLASSLHVISSPMVWSLHLSGFGLPHSMAAWSIKSEHLTQQRGNHPAFYELVLEVS